MANYLLRDVKYHKVMVPIWLKMVRHDGIPVMTDEPAKAQRFATADDAEAFRQKHLSGHWFRSDVANG
ncbi:hypothetical protein ACO2Q8_07920 [Larkinella sp. VNQ87]|uniref:hypothetical protein n=1 Tax=Larkinella sp. VNQ87 TaxID=3400921 RepID=UPI003C08DFDA